MFPSICYSEHFLFFFSFSYSYQSFALSARLSPGLWPLSWPHDLQADPSSCVILIFFYIHLSFILIQTSLLLILLFCIKILHHVFLSSALHPYTLFSVILCFTPSYSVVYPNPMSYLTLYLVLWSFSLSSSSVFKLYHLLCILNFSLYPHSQSCTFIPCLASPFFVMDVYSFSFVLIPCLVSSLSVM